MGGEDYLRYVMKNKDTGEVLFVVVFRLLHREEVEREDLEAAKKGKLMGTEDSGRHEGEETFKPEADDLD